MSKKAPTKKHIDWEKKCLKKVFPDDGPSHDFYVVRTDPSHGRVAADSKNVLSSPNTIEVRGSTFACE